MNKKTVNVKKELVLPCLMDWVQGRQNCVNSSPACRTVLRTDQFTKVQGGQSVSQKNSSSPSHEILYRVEHYKEKLAYESFAIILNGFQFSFILVYIYFDMTNELYRKMPWS